MEKNHEGEQRALSSVALIHGQSENYERFGCGENTIAFTFLKEHLPPDRQGLRGKHQSFPLIRGIRREGVTSGPFLCPATRSVLSRTPTGPLHWSPPLFLVVCRILCTRVFLEPSFHLSSQEPMQRLRMA